MDNGIQKTETKARLQEMYENEWRAELMKKLGLANIMTVPRLSKVVLNMGIGDAVNDRKYIEHGLQELSAIAGQSAVITRAKNSVASFKLRKGQAIGVKVTLRKRKMYEFMDRLVNIALPRVRDFRGLNAKSFDGHGNYAFGLKEQIVFMEINYDKIAKVRGLDVILCTTASNDEHSKELLKMFNMPFRER